MFLIGMCQVNIKICCAVRCFKPNLLGHKEVQGHSYRIFADAVSQCLTYASLIFNLELVKGQYSNNLFSNDIITQLNSLTNEIKCRPSLQI